MSGNKLVPTDGMVITRNTTFIPGTYVLPSGISIDADSVTLDGGGAVLVGANHDGTAVTVNGRSNVTVKNLRIRDYFHGISARDCAGLTISDNQIASTAEVPPNTIFLDIWRGPDDPYGGAIILRSVAKSTVADNRIQHQQNGLLTYHCRDLTVRANQANYNSGFGIHLYHTCDSVFEENSADYCCRFEPREGGRHYGHMGADAAGFLAVYGSSRNVFRRNTARMGGDGFFLAGLTPGGEKMGCDENLFEENDGSLSPNIAFEATFCRGNIFRDNYADRCNYGFWLGFSWDTVIESNRMVMNRQAGIAVENAHGMTVRGNSFQANGSGILLWSRRVESLVDLFPGSLTSYDWNIEGNNITRNTKGIRIAADQDHGIRNLDEGLSGSPETRPRDHRIHKNDIQDNRVGIELHHTDATIIVENTLNRNVEANVRQEDTEGTILRNNPGSAGGFL